jgi:hypothetical protein
MVIMSVGLFTFCHIRHSLLYFLAEFLAPGTIELGGKYGKYGEHVLRRHYLITSGTAILFEPLPLAFQISRSGLFG